MATIDCPFLGIITVQIATLTTTYSPISSNGNWDPHNIQPIEGKGYTGSPVPTGEGVNANVLSINAGALQVTEFNLGSNTGTADDLSGIQPVIPLWLPTNGGTLLAIGTNANTAGTLQPIGNSYSMPLNGTAVIDASFPGDGTQLELLPTTGSNNATPGANLGWGGYACMPGGLDQSATGILYSWQVNLSGRYGVWDGTNNFQGTLDPGYGHSNFNLGLVLPDTPNKLTHAWFNTTTTGGGDWYLDSDMGVTSDSETGNINSISFGQPASSTFDFQSELTALTGHEFFRATSLGFLQMYSEGTTITVNGVTLPGFGFLMLPDMSGYYLLEIESTDSGSANWNSSSTGQLFGAIDFDGYLWLKQTNTHGLLMASLAPVQLNVQSPQQVIVGNLGVLAIPHFEGILK